MEKESAAMFDARRCPQMRWQNESDIRSPEGDGFHAIPQMPQMLLYIQNC